MSNSLHLCLLGCLLLLSRPGYASPNPLPRNVESLYGPDALDILRHPQRVEACLLGEGPEWKTIERTKRRPVQPDLQARLSSLLSNDKIYGWDFSKSYLPDYAARLIFIKEGKELVIDFSFTTNVLYIRSGSINTSEDFDAARELLLSAFKGMFRNDTLLQKLK